VGQKIVHYLPQFIYEPHTARKSANRETKGGSIGTNNPGWYQGTRTGNETIHDVSTENDPKARLPHGERLDKGTGRRGNDNLSGMRGRALHEDS